MLSFFPRDVLDEIWDLTESVSKGFLPTLNNFCKNRAILAISYIHDTDGFWVRSIRADAVFRDMVSLRLIKFSRTGNTGRRN